ncbi:sensor histidine kinase [Thalassomonas actiniarum]|uniref:histidine kinase n=1 Tax=Thalassomonas actiniarum TaxID=485447 RepID=A0AAF0C328_9GAMM|nr:ATP-binding protein [Thalassomonas actiniarum]WDD98244.1 histidine kinase [Thalassomonas actiniarum]
MDNISRRPLIIFTANLVLLITCVVLLTCMYIKTGISPAWLLVLTLSVSFTAALFSLLKSQNKQLIQVIRALANGDNTLGFARHHPMREYYDQVKQQMQSARFAAEHQSEFLKALLVHIDLAVLVCDGKGNVVDSNPAVARLMGKSIKNLSELSHIGTMVLAAEKNLRSTVQWLHGEQQDTLTLQVSIAEIQGKEHKIVTLQSIHEMLLNKEQQAYKRLTQVLTHEVANTITPLASIAQTCEGLIPQQLCFSDDESKQDLSFALQTLASRTHHLGEFIASFRQISSLPMPQLVPVAIDTILEHIQMLHRRELKESKIELAIDIQCRQLVMLDSGQIEQVLINLVKNAIEALTLYFNQVENIEHNGDSQGKIKLTAAKNDAQQLFVEITDNGAGIAKHVIEMIFVPFFTTKQQGSGIGLSLSRQIMINHGGDLVYVTRSQGACFRCIFG